MEVPEYFVGGYFAGASEIRNSEQKPSDHFNIEDLLNFPNDDGLITNDGFFDSVAGNSGDSSTITVVDSCNSSVSGGDHQFSGHRSFADSHFSGDLCVPYEDMAQLEWLSNFVEDSFSTEKDLQSLHFLAPKPLTPETPSSSDTSRNAPFFPHETPLPGKARSKRSRAAPGDWTTRLLHLVNPHSGNTNTNTNADVASKPLKPAPPKKVDGSGSDSSGRRCLHCAAEKTPQWRTGPMGPKTLCNACGVRFKSGRLVPEYRPAASPTFVSAKHSNSHRKVLELRRQKDNVHRAHHHHHHHHQFVGQSSIFGVSNGGDDFLIHHHGGPDYRHLM